MTFVVRIYRREDLSRHFDQLIDVGREALRQHGVDDPEVRNYFNEVEAMLPSIKQKFIDEVDADPEKQKEYLHSVDQLQGFDIDILKNIVKDRDFVNEAMASGRPQEFFENRIKAEYAKQMLTSDEPTGNRQFDEMREQYHKMRDKLDIPEWTEDLIEGLTVGGATAAPFLFYDSDTMTDAEKAAVMTGSIAGASLIGSSGRRIGAFLGKKMHPGELKPGPLRNMGSNMGREKLMVDTLDAALLGDKTVLTGEHAGRAIGRMAGDELGAIAGVMGGLALARALQGTPAPEEQGLGGIALGVLPGTAFGLATSGISTALADVPGMVRGVEALGPNPTEEEVREFFKTSGIVGSDLIVDQAKKMRGERGHGR